MDTLHVSPAIVNLAAYYPAWVTIDRDPDGTWLWRINRTRGRMSTASREAYPSMPHAITAATQIALSYDLPLLLEVGQ